MIPRVLLVLVLAAVVIIASTGLTLPITGARETQGAAITKNLMLDGWSGLLYPRVDFAGDAPGYILMEFPLVNLLAAFFASLLPSLGDSAFKLPSILLALLAVWAIYDLVALQLGSLAGAVASGVFAFYPLHLQMAASPRPDESGLALTLLSLALFQRYLMNNKPATAISAFVIFALATLAKSTNAFALIIMIGWTIAQRGPREAVRRFHILGWALSSLPVALWTLHASRVNATSFIWEGRAVLDAVAGHAWQKGRLVYFLSHTWYAGLLFRFAAGASAVGLTLAAPGVIACLLPSRRLRFIAPFLLGVIVYIAMFPDHTYAHDYYSLAVLPLLAILTAEGFVMLLARVPRLPRTSHMAIGVTIIAIVSIIGVPNALARIRAVNSHKYEFGKVAQRIVPSSDLLIVSAYSIPAWDGSIVYQTGRRAWKFSAKIIDELNPADMRELAEAKGKRGLFAKGRREVPIYVSKVASLTPTKLESLRLRGARYFGYMGHPNEWVSLQGALAQYVLARYPIVDITSRWVFVDLERPHSIQQAEERTLDEAGDLGARVDRAPDPQIVGWRCVETDSTARQWVDVTGHSTKAAFDGFLDASLFQPGMTVLESATRQHYR